MNNKTQLDDFIEAGGLNILESAGTAFCAIQYILKLNTNPFTYRGQEYIRRDSAVTCQGRPVSANELLGLVPVSQLWCYVFVNIPDENPRYQRPECLHEYAGIITWAHKNRPDNIFTNMTKLGEFMITLVGLSGFKVAPPPVGTGIIWRGELGFDPSNSIRVSRRDYFDYINSADINRVMRLIMMDAPANFVGGGSSSARGGARVTITFPGGYQVRVCRQNLRDLSGRDYEDSFNVTVRYSQLVICHFIYAINHRCHVPADSKLGQLTMAGDIVAYWTLLREFDIILTD